MPWDEWRDEWCWWVPIAGPIAGAVAGGWLYDLLVGNRFPGGESPMSAASHHPVPQPGQLPPDWDG